MRKSKPNDDKAKKKETTKLGKFVNVLEHEPSTFLRYNFEC